MAIFVYLLRCSDGAYYIGSHRGEDVAHRVADHNAGRFPQAWTQRRRPVELVWAESFESALDATAVERQLKGWTRAKKEALIRGDWATSRPWPAVGRLVLPKDQDEATNALTLIR